MNKKNAVSFPINHELPAIPRAVWIQRGRSTKFLLLCGGALAPTKNGRTRL